MPKPLTLLGPTRIFLVPSPSTVINKILPREDVYAGGRGLVSGVRVSFAKPTMDGRYNSPSLDGGWGVRPTEDAPGSARARKAPAPFQPASRPQKISCFL